MAGIRLYSGFLKCKGENMQRGIALFAALSAAILHGCNDDQSEPVKRISYKQVQQERHAEAKRRVQPMIDRTMAAFVDPDSVRILEERYYSDESFGDSVCLRINAKNRMGGYGGAKWYFFSPRNNDVIIGANTLCSKAVK